jgi:hypothetical protein
MEKETAMLFLLTKRFGRHSISSRKMYYRENCRDLRRYSVMHKQSSSQSYRKREMSVRGFTASSSHSLAIACVSTCGKIAGTSVNGDKNSTENETSCGDVSLAENTFTRPPALNAYLIPRSERLFLGRGVVSCSHDCHHATQCS